MTDLSYALLERIYTHQLLRPNSTNVCDNGNDLIALQLQPPPPFHDLEYGCPLKSGNHPSNSVIYLRFVRKKEEEEEEEKEKWRRRIGGRGVEEVKRRWRRTKPKASHGDAPVF
ncbi:hypothetical protein M8J76_015131 [Diaphorina citri]|nr:hypothetical protein M8J76_015131 [Diaphorina citri]